MLRIGAGVADYDKWVTHDIPFTHASVKRAAEMLKDDLEVMRPVRLAEVQEAQQAIVTVALQLKNDGKLVIAGAGGDEFV